MGRRSRLPVRGLPLMVALVSAGAAGAAEPIYKWYDSDGKPHFSDRPPAEVPAETVKLRINTYSSPKVRTLDRSDAAADGAQVVMYSAAWCGVCKKARAYFRDHRVRFVEFDVETSRRGQREFRKLGGRGVPVILVGNQRMDGFSAQRFEQMVAKSRR